MQHILGSFFVLVGLLMLARRAARGGVAFQKKLGVVYPYRFMRGWFLVASGFFLTIGLLSLVGALQFGQLRPPQPGAGPVAERAVAAFLAVVGLVLLSPLYAKFNLWLEKKTHARAAYWHVWLIRFGGGGLFAIIGLLGLFGIIRMPI